MSAWTGEDESQDRVLFIGKPVHEAIGSGTVIATKPYAIWKCLDRPRNVGLMRISLYPSLITVILRYRRLSSHVIRHI